MCLSCIACDASFDSVLAPIRLSIFGNYTIAPQSHAARTQSDQNTPSVGRVWPNVTVEFRRIPTIKQANETSEK